MCSVGMNWKIQAKGKFRVVVVVAASLLSPVKQHGVVKDLSFVLIVNDWSADLCLFLP